MLDTIINIILELAIPWAVLILNILHIPRTVKQIIVAGEYSKLVSPSEFKSQWFANFWATIGPEVKASFQPDVEALLQGRFMDGIVHDDVVCEPISGVVLEVGVGNGAWMDVLARSVVVDSARESPSRASSSRVNRRVGIRSTTAPLHDSGLADARHEPKITKIYGIEPNPSFAAPLRKRIRDLHLAGIYQVIPAGIEQIARPDWRDRIPEGSIDSIVCICCLCSIPNPEENIKLLYKLLKPGGRWYIHEHVKATRGGLLLRAYQRHLGLFYSPLMGGCKLRRPTLKSILSAGPFRDINIAQPVREPPYQVFPRIVGVLTK